MAVEPLLTEIAFRQSRFGAMADQINGPVRDIIAQAESFVQSKLDRSLAFQEHVELITLAPTASKVFLRERPIEAVSSLRSRVAAGHAWRDEDLDGYSVDVRRGVVSPSPNAREVEVTYTAGYTATTLPADLKAALLIQTALFAYQDFKLLNLQSDHRPPGVLYMEDQVDRLLKPYRKVVVP